MAFEVIEREGKRVLTTVQVASAYNTEPKALMRNFQRNKDHFEQGIHFLALTGDLLKAFKGERQNDVSLKFVSVLYLWTEEGALMLAKSLNNDKAWQAYNLLLNQYFKMANEFTSMNAQQALPYYEKRLLTLENRVGELEGHLQNVTLHSGEQKRVQRAVAERIYALTKKQAERAQLFRELYGSLKLRYEVGSYRDIKQPQMQDALSFISGWKGGVHK